VFETLIMCVSWNRSIRHLPNHWIKPSTQRSMTPMS